MKLCRLCIYMVCLASMVACQKHEEATRTASTACPPLDAGTPVDPVLLAFLGKARAAHHSADLFEQQNKDEAAIKALSSLVASGSIPKRPEAQEVVQDTRARLADLQSRAGKFQKAMRHVEAGLALAKEATYFRGHLLEMRGLVEERRARELRASGDTAAAARAEKRALQAFEEAMRVQQRVIERALPGVEEP